MTALRFGPDTGAQHLIDDAIRANGAIRVLWAAALAVLRNRPRAQPRPPDASTLSAHLQRDIGLTFEPEAADWTRYI